MSEDSTHRPRSRKPAAPKKPRPDFPLSIHKGTGYWCKKVRGQVHYFGKVADDPKGVDALEEWNEVKDDLLAGREPHPKSDGLTVEDLCFRFLANKEHLRDTGELNPRTYQGYFATCETTAKALGRTRVVVDLVPDDFRKLRATLSKTRGVVALRNEMQRVRSIFKFAFDEGLIPSPVRFGQSFAKPKFDAVRRAREAHRSEHGDRMFEAAELRLILDYLDGKEVTLDRKDEETGKPVKVRGSRSPALKAMLLLAANCGFGQTDLSSLPTRALDLDAGRIDFARVKTAVPRRIPLWPETVAAIRDWFAERPKAKAAADAALLFLTRRGQRWVKICTTGAPSDAIGQEFRKILDKLELKRAGVGFYALRHGFETVAGETADQVAVDAIMGHVPQGMAAAYRERIGDDRLRRVTEHVREWLFARDGGSDPERGPEICDPSDPCDPTQENVEKSGSHTGRKRRGGSQTGAARSDVATRENPTKTWNRVAGSDGSQNRGASPPGDDARPALRLFVG